MKAVPAAAHWGDVPAQQGVSMSCVSWQREAVLLEGYPLGSVGQQGLGHITAGPEAQGRDKIMTLGISRESSLFW